MQTVHGSMMDAVGKRPAKTGGAQPQQLPAAALHWAALAQGWAVQDAATRMAHQQASQAVAAGAALPALAFDPTAWREGLALAGVIGQQWMSLQSLWLESLGEYAAEASQLRRANTVSKFVDQEMNLLQQGLALLSNQATASARLGENIQANLGYWLSLKVQAA